MNQRYSFQMKRLENNTLLLKFDINLDEFATTPEKVRTNLSSLYEKFRHALVNIKIAKQCQLKLNWKAWTLIIIADQTILDKIVVLLQKPEVGTSYLVPSVATAPTALFYQRLSVTEKDTPEAIVNLSYAIERSFTHIQCY